MKQEFFEYYKPSVEELASLWNDAIITVDANVC